MATVGLPGYDDVNNLYQQKLGRGASQDEYQKWISGQFGATDLSGIGQQIANSGEAQQYAQRAQKAPNAAAAPQTDPNAGQWTPPSMPKASLAPSASGGQLNYDSINGLYQQLLGRQASQDEATNWINGTYGPADYTSIQNQIAGSGEAQAYLARQGGGGQPSGGGGQPSGGGDPGAYLLQLLQSGMDRDQAISQTSQMYGLQPGQDGYPLWYSGNNTIGLKGSYLANVGGKWNQVMRDPREGQGGGGYSGGGGGPYAGTNVFSDPATANFEQLLNSLISRFNTPQTPPGYQQAIDQMNAYLTQLNGPVYTPQQMDLMQTQAWDPMQQQHDSAKQQLMQRLGARGIAPTSGVFESAMEDLDRQFQQAHTQTQANFSNQAVGLQRQNQAQAAQLAPMISNFQQAQTGWQDQRALQGESLAALIPAMAQQRLQTASGAVQRYDPTAIMTLINSMQNQGYNQGAGYGSGIAQLLASLFGLS